MKNQTIAKALMFVLGLFILFGGAALFVLAPELQLGYKVIIISAGISLMGIIIGVYAVIETIANLYEKFDSESAILKEGIGLCKEAVEILEAVNVVEIKKNKTVKDIYDMLSTGSASPSEGTPAPHGVEHNLKVEVDTSKLEKLLTEIKISLETQPVYQNTSSTNFEKEIFPKQSIEEIVNEEKLHEEVEEMNKISEDTTSYYTTAESSVSEPEIIIPAETEMEAEIEEESEISTTVEENIEFESAPLEEEPVVQEAKPAIMSAGDYFAEDEPKVNKVYDIEEPTQPAESKIETPKEEITQNMVYGLVAEEPSVQKEDKRVIKFADVVIEDIVRDMLEKPSEDIFESDIVDIDVLLAGNQGVKRLEGVENLINLQKLDLWKAEISSIEILKPLKKLLYLRLSKTMVSDLSPIRELENLEELYLQEVPVESLKPLSSLQRLKYLYLEKTKIDSLEPLLEISTLEELYLWGSVVDLTPGGINSEVLKKLESRGCSIIK